MPPPRISRGRAGRFLPASPRIFGENSHFALGPFGPRQRVLATPGTLVARPRKATHALFVKSELASYLKVQKYRQKYMYA